jgi:hypothetical protein
MEANMALIFYIKLPNMKFLDNLFRRCVVIT